MYPNNNNLLNRWNNYSNTSGNQYRQNNLINGNVHLNKERMQNMNEQMNKIKDLYRIKQMEKFSDLDRYVDKNNLTQSVIKPIKIVKLAPEKVKNDYSIIQQQFAPLNNKVVDEYWKNRTNQPYKGIIKTDDYKKISLHGAKKEDLIVHKVTDADKLGLVEEFNELRELLEKHDGELTIIYSSSKKAEHLSKFKYNNAAKFKIKYDPADFSKLKKDRIKQYQREQKKLEGDKRKIQDLINAAVKAGTLTEQEIKELKEESENEPDDMKEIDEELKKELGDVPKKIDEEESDSESEKSDTDIEIEEPTRSSKSKIIIKSKNKKTDKPDKPDKSVKPDKPDKMSELKEKYKSRQKKI